MEKISNKFFFKLFVIVFYLFIFFILIHQTFAYLDPDFGWHLKFGEEMSQTGAVPRVNSVNYVLEEIPLLDHEWLSDWIIYEVYANYGYEVLGMGFVILMTIIYVLQYFFVKRYFLKNSIGLWLFFPIQLFAVCASLPSLGVRVQVVTLLFSLLTFFIIYEYQRSEKKWLLLFLPVLFWFWASLHGGFVLGLILLFFFTVIKLIEILWKPANKIFFLSGSGMSFKSWIFFASASLGAFLITFLTPYKLELYSFLTTYKNDTYLQYITEWFHQFKYPFVYFQIISLEFSAIVLILWVVSTFWIKKKGYRFTLWEVFLILFFTFFAFKSRRHFPLFAVIVLPIIVGVFVYSIGLKDKKMSFVVSKNLLTDVLVKIFLILCLLVGIMLQVERIKIFSDPWKAFPNKYPVEALEFFNNHPELQGKRMLNDYTWGGYFIWNLPEEKLFIDGRLPQYPYNGHSMLEEYGDFFAVDKQEEMLNKHGIEVIFKKKFKPIKPTWWEKEFLGVIENDPGPDNENLPIYQYLNHSLEWKKIYDDGVAEIYIRR